LGRRKIVFWEPPVVEDQANVRRSSNTEAAELLAELVRSGVRSICFSKSRRAAEVIYQQTADLLKDTDPALAERVTPYRAGYTPEQRRSIETMLFGGQLLAVVSTSALELGIDIGALDAAITVGYPGTMASLWQQWGRAGRGKGESLAVFVAGNDALEQFFVKHPGELLGREVEAATIDFANPFIHGSHLAAAAYEAPIKEDDQRFFGSALRPALERATGAGLLRSKGDAWFNRGTDFPAAKIGLRSTVGEQFTIVEEETGDIIGTEGAETAFSTLHPGAVYLHMGDNYLVNSLDLDSRTALVRPFWDNYHTLPRRETETRILSEDLRTTQGPASLHLGRISVSTRVVAFQKRRLGSEEALGTEELDLPQQEFVTEGMWFTLPLALFPQREDLVRLPGAIHAMEHALIALLPLFAMCDRWDIGGLSTNIHPQTGRPTIFVYDGHPGGVGITERGFDRFEDWVAGTARLLGGCPCERGCPSCVQSPKCGNLNEPLHKAGALELLGRMSGRAGTGRAGSAPP
jgi:DEAD/DEAH box helicase domain-containing protein